MKQSRSWGRVLAPMLMVVAGCGGDDSLTPEIVDGAGGTAPALGTPVRSECESPRPEWIWCDDFERDRLTRYFEYVDAGGRFVRLDGIGIDGSPAMRARFEAGDTDAGSLKLAFGRVPKPYIRPVDTGSLKYRDVYWRLYLRNESGWTGGGGYKLTRSQILTENWAQAMVAPVWSGDPDPATQNHLLLDPASGTDVWGTLRSTGYNDEAGLRYLGARAGATPIFDADHVGEWHCVEVHTRLNHPGWSNGLFELWVDGELDARSANLNWVGSFTAYGINTVFVENYWNGGAPRAQERYIDNLVVSTQRIGCGATAPPPEPVATVAVSPLSAVLPVGSTQQFTADLEDALGNPLLGRTVEWTSSNTSVATVDATGLVSALTPGSATITANSEGRSDSGSVEVQSTDSSPEAWLEVDFEDYTSTTALLSDCTTWSCSEDNGTPNIHLDSSVGYPAGGLTKSMRFDYLHAGDGCNSITDSRQLALPTRTREVWAEFVVRWTDNFTTTNNDCVPNDHKLIFGNTAKGNTGRWGFYVGSDTGPDHTLMIEQPGLPLRGAYYLNGGPEGHPELTGTDLWDGNWHVIRLHFRHSVGNVTGDGRLQAWIDGVLRHDEVVNTPTSDGGPDLLRALTLGRNKDDGPPGVLMSLWWARVRIWNTDPGW